MWINYLGYRSVFLRSIHSLSSVYEFVVSGYPIVPIGAFQNGIVLIGNSDIMGSDMYSTPFGISIPGVAIQAMAINSMLQGKFISTVPWYYNLLILVFSVFCMSYVQRSFSPRSGVICLVVLLSCIWICSFASFQLNGAIINASQPMSGVVFAYAAITFYNYLTELKRVRRIKEVFGKHVSQEVMDQLVLEKDGEIPVAEQDVSVLFADISDHSSLARDLLPVEFAKELNECLKVIAQAVSGNGGTINRFLGDGLLASYNAPITQSDHVLRAVKTGIAIQENISELNKKRASQSKKPVAVRVGINTGSAMVGTFGSKDRFEYAIVGDAINMAKRAEGECEPGRVAITDDVICNVGRAVQTEILGLRSVKGREQGLMLHHVIGIKGVGMER